MTSTSACVPEVSEKGEQNTIRRTFENPQHAEKLLERLRTFRSNSELNDSVLTTNSESVPAHRIVLASFSKYCEDIFKGKTQDIVRVDIDKSAIEAVVEYCYTGKIELNEHNVGDIQAVAALLKIKELITVCNELLQEIITSNKCAIDKSISQIDTFLLAARQFVPNTIKNFMNVYKTTEFLQTGLEEFVEIINSDDLNVPSENYVFDAVRQWILFDINNRTALTGPDNVVLDKTVTSVLDYVRFPQLTLEYLFDEVKHFTNSVPECYDRMFNALKLILNTTTKPEVPENWTIPRKSTAKIFAVGSNQTNTCSDIEIYNPWTDKWSLYLKMNVDKVNYAVATTSDKLIIAGGLKNTTSSDTIDIIHLQNGSMSKLPSMIQRRYNAGAAILLEDNRPYLYVMGGTDGRTHFRLVEKFEFSSNKWAYVDTMHEARQSFGIVPFNGKIYVAGGENSYQSLNAMEMYDPNNIRWENKAPMKSKRNSFSLVEFGGCLYAIGGYQNVRKNDPLNSVEKYDPATDLWTTYVDLPSPRGAVGSGFMGDYLILVGGNNHSILFDVDLYNTKKNEWKTGKQLVVPRDGAHVIPVPWNVINNIAPSPIGLPAEEEIKSMASLPAVSKIDIRFNVE